MNGVTQTNGVKKVINDRYRERGGEGEEGGESATAPQEGALCCYILRQRHDL